MRAILGERYRAMWATPLRIPVLPLKRFAGGLAPTRAHAGSQTVSLRFDGADGRTYQFRQIDKNPTAKLVLEMQVSLAGRALQDGVSSSNPMASLVASALLEAVGVLPVTQTLVVLPDDSTLGEFRKDFARRFGLIEGRPNESGSFAGAFLVARLLDILMGDRDRHRDQFRCATFGKDDDDVHYWRPISRDHDEAFVRIEGPALAVARLYVPQLTTFAEDYDAPYKLNWHAREIDRWLA